MSHDTTQAGRKSGFWFSIARIAILAQVLATLAFTVWNLPAAYRNLRSFTPNLGFQGWSTSQLQAAVQASGLSPDVLANLMFAASLVCLLSFWTVAALLAFRKSGSWIGLLMIYILVSTAPGFTLLGSRVSASPSDYLGIYEGISVALIWPTFFVLQYLFPDGRVVPGWTRFLLPIPYLAFFIGVWLDQRSSLLSLMQLLILVFAAGGIASQIYRYRKVSTPSQKQQTKWVVLALAIVVIGAILTQIIPLLDPSLEIGTSRRFLVDLWFNYFLGVVLAILIPLSIGISILRYRLWDIDLIIRRTLLYALLTGLLGLVYFGSVLLLRQMLGGLASTSNFSIVLSTLLVAALFEPVRRRVQSIIDRRFYRQKYDAEQALADFSASARREVSLDNLSANLASVVQHTVQPERIFIWIQSSESKSIEDK